MILLVVVVAVVVAVIAVIVLHSSGYNWLRCSSGLPVQSKIATCTLRFVIATKIIVLYLLVFIY